MIVQLQETKQNVEIMAENNNLVVQDVVNALSFHGGKYNRSKWRRVGSKLGEWQQNESICPQLCWGNLDELWLVWTATSCLLRVPQSHTKRDGVEFSILIQWSKGRNKVNKAWATFHINHPVNSWSAFSFLKSRRHDNSSPLLFSCNTHMSSVCHGAFHTFYHRTSMPAPQSVSLWPLPWWFALPVHEEVLNSFERVRESGSFDFKKGPGNKQTTTKSHCTSSKHKQTQADWWKVTYNRFALQRFSSIIRENTVPSSYF